MGNLTVTGAIVLITAWTALVEFDSYPESKRKQILQKIKSSPAYILLIALLPIGIFINLLGGFFRSPSMVLIGASLILLQGIIVGLLFWNRKRWKSIFLLVVMAILGIFLYSPFLI